MLPLDKLIRKNIRQMKPYSSARGEFTGDASVFLDANENPYNEPYNRYPDPLQRKLKLRIAEIKGTLPEYIFLGVGSDEPIDLLMRAFCEPALDSILTLDPTYGMYEVAANTNNVTCKKVLLDNNFDIDIDKLKAATDDTVKMIYLCSPNNPTGNLLNRNKIINILNWFQGIVVLDEAYIDFVPESGFISELEKYPNLVILQTFSKAWGMAGLRLGMAFASPDIIAVLNKIKYPYNINALTQKTALELISDTSNRDKWVSDLLQSREYLTAEIQKLPYVNRIYPSDANFILVKTDDPQALYNYLTAGGIIVRNRNSISLCAGCLRITVGCAQENEVLVSALKQYPADKCYSCN